MGNKAVSSSAVTRIVSVLGALTADAQPRSLAQISRETQLPKPTLYRLLHALEAAGVVRRDPQGRHYSGSDRLERFARRVLVNSTASGLRRVILQSLVADIGETCNFTMLDGAQVLYLDRVETSAPLRMNLQPGSHVPLHCTASGKLLLAMQPKAKRAHLIANLPLARYTARTIMDRRALEQEVESIREKRYAIEDEEFYSGLACVAVPVRVAPGRITAALAVQAPLARTPVDRQVLYLPRLRAAAEQMEHTFQT